MANPRILIERDGEGFVVRVDPAPAGPDLSGRYGKHRDAFGFASGLRLAHRWPIVDLASDAHLADILRVRK